MAGMNRREFIKQSKWCLALLAPMPVLAQSKDDLTVTGYMLRTVSQPTIEDYLAEHARRCLSIYVQISRQSVNCIDLTP